MPKFIDLQGEKFGRLTVLQRDVSHTGSGGHTYWICRCDCGKFKSVRSDELRNELMEKKILDVTCGARSIWFNKHHPAAVYCDKRREQYHNLWKNAGNCTLDINPDVVCDFTDLPFPDNSFPLVVFDPPHLTGAKETAWLVKKYGKLDENWPKMLHDGFRECMRVLKPDGVLIFKWSEYDIPAAEVWKAIGQKPLFGHHSGKQSRTFWGCFMKLEEMEMLRL